MAREKKIMELYDILKRLKAGHSIKQIGRETGTHRTVIRKLKKLACRKNWLDRGKDLPGEKDLHESYYGAGTPLPHPLDDFFDELNAYAEDGISYVVMHQLIRDRVHASESSIRRYVQSRIEPSVPRSFVQRLREMSVMEVDFGRLGIVYDPREKRNRAAYVFSARLRYSALAYRDIVYAQDQETFWSCNIRAFEYFGGVPSRVVPDNLKSAVIQASFTDPVINRGYHDLGTHYGFLIDPCLPFHPEHKGGVESDIKYVKRNFYAAFRMKQKRLGRDIPLADDILPALREWERDIADVRIIKSMGQSPLALFEREAPSLLPLPAERFDPVSWGTVTVKTSSRISFDRSTYSVPERYIGKKALLAVNSRKIRVFFDHELIAEHPRSARPHQDIVNPDHLGHRARAYMEYTRENLFRKAGEIGPSARELSSLLLSDPVVAKERSVRGIICLVNKYGRARVNAACRRALDFDTPRYDTVKRILVNGLDKLTDEHPEDSHGQRLFAFARTHGYFDTSTHIKEEHS